MMQPFLRIFCMFWLSAAAEDCQECQGSASPSKAGVAMLARTKKTEFASGFASMEDVKTDGIEREAALINKVLTNPTAELTESMVNQLASMRITPEVETFIDATLKEMIPVFDALQQATYNDTAERDKFLDRFDEIQEELTNNKAEHKIGKNLVDGFRKSHKKCRDEQQEKYDDLIKCRTEEHQLLLAKQAAAGVLDTRTSTVKGLICEDDDVTNNLPDKIESAGPFAEAGRKYIEADEAHKNKVKECNSHDQALKEKIKVCDGKQTMFETQMCTYGGKFKSWCTGYDTKYETEKSAFFIVWDNIKSRVTKRLFEWKHLKRVECVLQALKKLAKDWSRELITETIEGCNSNPFHNKNLEIEEKPIPVKVSCPYTKDLKLPCSDDFIKKEYSALPTNAPAADCVGDCSGTI